MRFNPGYALWRVIYALNPELLRILACYLFGLQDLSCGKFLELTYVDRLRSPSNADSLNSQPMVQISPQNLLIENA